VRPSFIGQVGKTVLVFFAGRDHQEVSLPESVQVERKISWRVNLSVFEQLVDDSWWTVIDVFDAA